MASYPKDRFDQLPDDLKRIGAHRGPKKGGGGWVVLAWCLLATGILVFGGLYGVSKYLGVDLGIPIFAVPATPTPTPTPTPTMDPILDPLAPEVVARQITVTVLNGTTTSGLQTTVGTSLGTVGWVVNGMAKASTDDIEETTVYYSDPLNEDAARGVVVSLGIGKIRLVPVETFPGATLTVVLGSDYPGAG